MDTATRTVQSQYDNLIMLRKKVQDLATQSEDEEILAEIVAMLSGIKRPCTYSREEFKMVLQESDADYKAGRLTSHEELFAQYGL